MPASPFKTKSVETENPRASALRPSGGKGGSGKHLRFDTEGIEFAVPEDMVVEEEGLLSAGSNGSAGSPEPKRFKGDGRDVMEDSSAESGGVRPGSGGSGGVGQGLSGLEGGKGGDPVLKEEPTMTDLMLEMRNMRLSLDTKLTSMQGQLGDLKNELATLRAEMVTKEIFESLEVRVSKLETQGAPNTEVS